MRELTLGQIILLVCSITLFLAGWSISLMRLWSVSRAEGLRVISKACDYGGLIAGLVVVTWHSTARGSWVPLEDNFDAFAWLGLLLALFVLYLQAARPLRGIDWFLLPVVALLLIAAGIFSRAKPHEYNVKNVWFRVHLVTAYGGAAAFAVAAAVGAMYLVVNRRLRSKRTLSGPGMGSLERLENLTTISVAMGLALLTIGAITGGVWMISGGKETPIAKIVLTAIVWVLYAVVLHAPINPSFRGRKAAVLSVVGFAMMVGTIVAVQFL